MKSTLKTLILVLCMGGLTALFSCGDDDPDPGNGGDFCDFEVCASNNTAKQVCIDEYNDCLATGNLSDDECLAFANETCTL